MKFLIAAIFGVLLTLSQASDDIGIDNSGNTGGSVNQHVNIDNHDNIANINKFDGWNSWDSICDYGTGFAATRLYSKKICVINKMKPNFPTLDQLSAIAENKEQAPPTTYTVDKTPIPNIEDYGKHIEALCRGMPAYNAIEMQEFEGEFAGCNANSIITVFGVTFCF